MTPAMSAVIVEIVNDAFKPEEVAVFEGDASLDYLTSLSFDHIFLQAAPQLATCKLQQRKILRQ